MRTRHLWLLAFASTKWVASFVMLSYEPRHGTTSRRMATLAFLGRYNDSVTQAATAIKITTLVMPLGFLTFLSSVILISLFEFFFIVSVSTHPTLPRSCLPHTSSILWLFPLSTTFHSPRLHSPRHAHIPEPRPHASCMSHRLFPAERPRPAGAHVCPEVSTEPPPPRLTTRQLRPPSPLPSCFITTGGYNTRILHNTTTERVSRRVTHPARHRDTIGTVFNHMPGPYHFTT